MDDLVFGVVKIDADAFHLDFFIPGRALHVRCFMNEFPFAYRFIGVFHLDGIGKEPQLAMANQVVVNMGSGYLQGLDVLSVKMVIVHLQKVHRYLFYCS